MLDLLKRYKPHLKVALSRVGIKRPGRRWITIQDNPDQPDVLTSFGLVGLISTWMEGDVIEATVRNAFMQGCERVLLVDNDSPDDTVARAVAAGAELAASFSTDQLDEALKLRMLNDTVAEVSAEDGRDHIWWLWLDADEFVHGPGGLTVRELLSGLDRRFRVVGSRYFNHFPDRKPEAVPGFHPLDFQPLCEEIEGQNCAATHRKHHLQRYDRGGAPLEAMIGFHTADCDEPLIEPSVSCFTHHLPYRAEAATRARLDALCGRDGTDAARIARLDSEERHDSGHISDMSRRYQTLDRVYAREWSQVDSLSRRGAALGIEPQPWRRLVDPEDTQSGRWYSAEDLEAVKAQ